MTKAHIILLCIAISSALSHTMELVTLTSLQKKKNFQINCIQDIPKLSLKDIRPCFNLLPEKKRNEILATKNKLLEQSLTFNIAMLQEGKLIHQILTCMMDGDEILLQLFYETPLWYAHKRYHDAYQRIHKLSSINRKISGACIIIQPIATLFKLSKHEQQQIIGILKPNPFTSQPTEDSVIFCINKENEEKIKHYDPVQEAIDRATKDITDKRNYRTRQWIIAGIIVGALFTLDKLLNPFIQTKM